MARTRLEIQGEVNGLRATIEHLEKNLKLEHSNETSKLKELERELAEAKARGEKGRSSEEIRERISETQSGIKKFDRTNSRELELAMMIQCLINSEQRELNEAIKEENAEKAKAETEEKALFDKMIADFNQQIQQNPNDAEVYCSRGGIYFQKEDYDKAIADYNEAIRLDANNAETYAFRGGAFFEKKNYDKALADHNEAIRLDHNCKLAYIGRASVYFDKGEYDKAVSGYEEVLRLDPNDMIVKAFLENARKLKADQEKNYNDLIAKRKTASNHETLFALSKEFRAMNGYKDTTNLAEECDRMAEDAKKKKYHELISNKETASSEDEFQNLNSEFLEMGNYENAKALADECNNKYRVLKERREEQERIEKERQEEEENKKKLVRNIMGLGFTFVPVIVGMVFYYRGYEALPYLLIPLIFLVVPLIILHFRDDWDFWPVFSIIVFWIAILPMTFAHKYDFYFYWGSLAMVVAFILACAYPKEKYWE